MKFTSPISFEELVNFSDSSNLECFKCMDKEAINYETKALHISAHMLFERTDVKHKWQGILQEFSFKTGHNKKVATTINNKR